MILRSQFGRPEKPPEPCTEQCGVHGKGFWEGTGDGDDLKTYAPEDISVVLTYYVEAALGDSLKSLLREVGGKRTATRRIEHLLRSEMRAVFKERLPVQPGVDLEALLSLRSKACLSDSEYLARLAHVICERLSAGPDAPSLRIAPKPLGRAGADMLLKDGVNFGLIFGAETIYFQDAVQALQTDEIRSRPEGERPVNVLGVHVDWRTDDGGRVKRALISDDTGSVREVAFEHPVALDLVATLHLPRSGERALHSRLSAAYDRIGVPQINPYEISRRADDKWRTHRLWEGRVPSPRAVRIPGGNPEQVLKDTLEEWADQEQSFATEDCSRGAGEQGSRGEPPCPLAPLLLRRGSVVVQPNTGTEGDCVARFEATAYREIARYIADRIGPDSDALLREERGNVRFFSEEEKEKGYRSIALRINVAWNGRDFVAESGYAQVARDQAHFVASRGRGGTLVPLGIALDHLYHPHDERWRRWVPTENDIAHLRQTAVQAAQALNAGLPESEYLKLLGIDFLLEVDEAGQFTPIALEANPRPAGLAQSWDIPRTAQQTIEPKVTFGLFEFIRSSLATETTETTEEGGRLCVLCDLCG